MADLGQIIAALRRDPTSKEAAQAVRQNARQDGRGALTLYAEAFAERGDTLARRGLVDDAVSSLVEAALVYEEDLEDLPTAARMYSRVLDLEAGHRRALFALGLLLHDLGRFEDLIELYRRRLAGTNDDGERTTLHLYVAEILSEKLGHDREAFEEVMKAARLAPTNIRIITRLQRLGEKVSALDEVAVVIGDLILHQEDPRVRAALALRLAELHLDPLNDPQRALAHFRAALLDDGGNPDVLQEVQDVFRERARFDELAELLEDAAKDRRIGPHRVRLERELAHIYETELKDKRRALNALIRATRDASPDDRELLDEVMRLGLMLQDMSSVAAAFEDVSKRTQNALLKTYLRLKLGHIYGGVLDQPHDAIRVFCEILEQDPDHREARRRLASLYERVKDYSRLDSLLEEDSRAAPPADAIDALRKVAQIRRDQLNDPKGSLSAFHRILDLSPGDPEAASAISSLAGIAGQGSTSEQAAAQSPISLADVDIAEVVGVSAVATDAASESATQYEGADWGPETETHYEGPLKSISPGVALYTEPSTPGLAEPPTTGNVAPPRFDSGFQLEVSASDIQSIVTAPPEEPLDPRNLPASISPGEKQVTVLAVDPAPARTAPPREVTSAGVREPGSVDVPLPTPSQIAAADGAVVGATAAPPAAAAPRPVAVLGPKLPPHVEEELLELQQRLQDATRVDDRPAQVEALRRIIQLSEQHNQLERAFFAAIRLVRLEATTDRVHELVRLGVGARAFAAMVDTYGEVASRLDAGTQVELGLEVARVEADALGDVTAALKRLAALHEVAPDEPSISALRTELLERTGNFDALVDVLLSEGRRIGDEHASRSAYEQAAKILESQVGSPSRAADALITFLGRAPEDDRIRSEAARLLELAGRYVDLAKLLEVQVYRLEPEQRSKARRRIAHIYSDRLGDSTSAERMLRFAVSENPRDTEALDQLIQIYELEGHWSELVEALTGQIPLIRGGRQRSALRRRVAEVAERRLRRVDLALQHLEEAVREDPADLEAIADLERLRRSVEDWSGVVDALVLRSRALSDRTERATALVGAARIRHEQLKDAHGAAKALKDALALAPDHQDALDELATISERTGDFEGAIRALQELAGLREGPSRGVAHARIGRILEMQLGDMDAAAREYGLALEADPDCLEALSQLRRWREEQEHFAEALDLTIHEARLTKDDRKRAALWVKAATIARHRVGDGRLSVSCLERALEADPEDLASEATLGELYVAQDEPDRAFPHLVRAARGLKRTDHDRALQLFIAAGEAAEKLGRDGDARGAYESALELSPRAHKPLLRMGPLLERAGEHARTHEVSTVLILHHENTLSTAERAAIYARMARAKHALEEHAASVRLAKKAVTLAPASPDAHALLADVLEAHNEPIEAAGVLEKLVDMVEKPARRDILVRASRLYGEAGNDLEHAAAALSKAHDIAPSDMEVVELLAVYREATGDFRGAAEALAATARLLEGRQRADLLVRASCVVSGAHRDRAEAKRLLREATRIAPTHKDGFRQLAVMFEFEGERLELAEGYERAANAFLGDPSTALDAEGGDRENAAFRCFDAAKRIYRFRLRRPEDALRMARAQRDLVRDDPALREEYARLVDDAAKSGGARRDTLLREAQDLWSEIVEAHPGSLDALRRLHAIRLELGHRRAARIPVEILVALDEATHGEERWLDAEVEGGDGSTGFARPVGADVPTDPNEESILKPILSRLGTVPIAALEDALAEPRPRRRDRMDVTQLPPAIRSALNDASTALGAEMPWIYVRDDAPAAVAPELAEGRPALLLSLAMASTAPPDVLRFMLGRALSLLRPRSLAIAILPLDVMREALEGFAKERVPSDLAFSDPKRAKKRGRALEKAIPALARAEIADRIAAWLADPGRRTLFEERESVLRTAERAGLIASGSVLSSVDALRQGGKIERSWFLPLIRFAASRSYASIIAPEAR